MSALPHRLVDDALEHVVVLRENAANMRLVAAIECLGWLPPDLRDRVCGADWPAVRATRNRLVHGYIDVDGDVVREAVRRELPGWEHELILLRERLRGDA